MNWLLRRWDRLVYGLAFSTFRRMGKRSPGSIYLVKLQLDQWLTENPISPEVREFTDRFFASQQALVTRDGS